MSTSSERAEARKNQILDAALLVFAQHGFAAARMDEIARVSGLSKGALYWYFPSKDALILALLQRLLASQLQYLQVLTESRGPIGERFFLFGRQFIDALTSLPQLTSLLLEFYALAARQDEVRQFFREFFRQYRAVIEGLFRQGIEQGEFRAMDTAEASQQFLALGEGLLLLYAFGSLTTPLPQSVQNALRFFLDGLRASPNVASEELPR
jgi:AcrR family transcriptional regulator